MTNRTEKEKGFVLLYAILVAGIVMVIGVTLSNIITKQIVLSSIGKNSQVSYYAADSGRDCATYWRAYPVSNPFGKTKKITGGGYEWVSPDGSGVTCHQNNISVANSSTLSQQVSNLLSLYGVSCNSDINLSSFSYETNSSGIKGCVYVDVLKDKHRNNACTRNGVGGFQGFVISRGYNVPCSQVTGNNLRLVERAVINSF